MTATAKSLYPQAPGFYAHAPETSRRAAAFAKESAASIRERVLAVFSVEHSGLTSQELSDKLWKGQAGTAAHEKFRRSVQSRISELSAQGKLADSGLRRNNESGVPAVVWRAASFKLTQKELI